MKKILFISNVSNKVDTFSKAAIMAAKKSGFEFHYASNWNEAKPGQIQLDEAEYGIIIHNVDIDRSPFSLKNIKAFKKIRDIVIEQGIEYIHCNTPVGGVIGRLLSSKVKKVIYEVHGFHFFTGAPIKNWILYYPIEKILACKTDAIITINSDDYDLACKKLHPSKNIYYVPGVGIELEQWDLFKDIRKECGITDTDFVILVVGRLEKNKNCETIINAVSQIYKEGIKLVFCGDGEDYQMLQRKAAEKKIKDRVIFLGKRYDMSNVYHMADCYVMASFREGLSRSIMEAMACGLPCVVSNIRGNRDLIDEKSGFLFNPSDVDKLKDCIVKIWESNELRQEMSKNNLQRIKHFSIDYVIDELITIYKEQYVSD